MNLLLSLFMLLFVAGIDAQRTRTSVPEAPSEAAPPRGRGRVKFTVPSDISEADLAEAAAPPIERKKTDRKVSRPSNKPYEVREVLDDIPNLNVRKIHKPRVITETRFEAANAPKKPLYVPLPLPEDEILPEDLLPNFAPQTARAKTEKPSESVSKETTVKVESSSQSSSTQSVTTELLPIRTNLGQPSELTTFSEQPSSTENEIKKLDATTPEIKRKQLEPLQIVTPIADLKKGTRLQGRPRLPTTSDETSTTRTRSRIRPVRKQDSVSAETSSPSSPRVRTRARPRDNLETSSRPSRSKTIRRRLDVAEVKEADVKGRVPSLFSAENTQEIPLRSRTGRKVNYPSANENENIQIEDRRYSLRRRPAHVKDRSTNSVETTTKEVEVQSTRDNGQRSPRRGSIRNGRNKAKNVEVPQKEEEEEERSTAAPNINRRYSPGRTRKVDINHERPSRIVESTESNRLEKQLDNPNKNVAVKATTRGRSHHTDKPEILEDATEYLRSRNRNKQIENEIPSTTLAPSSFTIKSRKVEYQTRNRPEVQSESKIEEKVVSTTQNTIATESRRNSVRYGWDTRRNKSAQESTTPEVTTSRSDYRRRSYPKKSTNVESPIKDTSTEAKEISRPRQRSRHIPPIIDEQKLEVLPLFESEAKTVAPIRRRPNTSKESLNLASSSEHQVKIGSSNEIFSDQPRVRFETKTEKVLIRTSKPIIKESVETKISEVVTKRKIGRQVVRKVKVNRTGNKIENADAAKSNETNVNDQKAEKVVTSTVRGFKRSEIKDKNKSVSGTSSEEEIGDSDNYPEPFKALIQAKLAKQTVSKGSRSQKTSNDDAITKSTERIVTSSRIVPITTTITAKTPGTTTTTTTRTTSSLQVSSSKFDDDDNELVPNSSTSGNLRPTRRRFSLTTKYPETEDATSRSPKRQSYSARKLTRSTVSPSQVSVITEVSSKVRKQPRYHARFSASKKTEKSGEKDLPKSSEKDVDVGSVTPKSRNYSPKPPRGLYSSRNGKKRTGKLESPTPTQQVATGIKKASRYSSRYRSDLFSRAGSTRPTSAPAYIPTVPTITPSPVKNGIVDSVSGMEVISIDDPVNTIPSDSLINGELLTPSNPHNPPSKLVPASLVTKDGGPTTASFPKSTEKPVSIIERIIYSITAISTASPDVKIDLTNDGPTKASAIFKIPSKTSKEDVTLDVSAQQRQQLIQTVTNNEIKPLTTEKPTTIIERILSSISAIQASSTTERTDTQVGSNLNTISTTFKPLSSKSVSTTLSTTVSTTLSPSSTPQDALDVIEQISSEQSLQERTISKLLALLKTITPDSTSTEKVVVVTPKATSFTSATSEATTINRDVEVFNVSSNLITETPERQGVAIESQISETTPINLIQNPTETTANDSENNVESRFGPTGSSGINSDVTSATPDGVASTNTPIDITTPDLLQNTIAQNVAGTESTTNTPLSTFQTNELINLNGRLPDSISISDFLATLDSLSSVEPTTISSTTTTIASTLTTAGAQTNENVIESTTPSSTNESATPANAVESTVSNEAPSTTVESANLVASTDVASTTSESATNSVILNDVVTNTTESGPSANLVASDDIATTTIGSDDVLALTDTASIDSETTTIAGFLSTDEIASIATESANSATSTIESANSATTTIESANSATITIESSIDTTPSILSRFELATDVESVGVTTISPQTSDDVLTSTESQQPTVTTEISSTTPTSESAPSTQLNNGNPIELTTESPESSNTIPGPTTISPSMIMTILGRLLEIANRTRQTLTTLSLEQTTVRTIDSSTSQPSTAADIISTFSPLTTLPNFEGDASRNSVITTDVTQQVTTSAPPTATVPVLADVLGGVSTTVDNDVVTQNATVNVDTKVESRSREIEEVNIEENTISNNGNNKPEKIIERTTSPVTVESSLQTSPPTTSPRPTTAAPVRQETTTPSTAEITAPIPTTTPFAAIRIDELEAGEETTTPAIDTTTITPTIESRFATNEALTTTTPRELTTERVTFTAPRYTITPTTVVPQFENLQLTIRATTPYLIQRIIGNVTGTPVRLGVETTSSAPLTTLTTEAPTTPAVITSRPVAVQTVIPSSIPTTAPTTVVRSRIQTPTTTQPPTTTQASTTQPPTTTQAPTTQTPTTTQDPTTTFRSRGRSRFSLTTPLDSLMRTVTVTPSTVSTPSPTTTDFPIRTTFIPIRYTQRPTTINVPSKIASFAPTTELTNIPTVTERNLLQTTNLDFQNAPIEISTVFPVYSSPVETTTIIQPEVTQQPSSVDITTNTLPTFAATQRPRQRITTTTTAPPTISGQQLAQLRFSENFGEISTTSDYFSSTTATPMISTTTSPVILQTTLKNINSKVRTLTEQQKKELEELAKLEKEQQAILQQLAFLTRLNLAASPKTTRSPRNMAGRVIDFASQRNKEASTQNPSSLNLLEALTAGNSKQTGASAEKVPSIEEILKQFNVNPNSVTASSLASTYGKSTDAILAALLKEQGIEPSTPKSLGDQLKTTTPFVPTTSTKRITTTRRRITTTTTSRPGPIMQGLNWLLNALAPAPTTKKPPQRKKVVATTTLRSNTIPEDVEIISSQPTELTPIVVTAPPRIQSAAPARSRFTTPSSRQSRRKPLHSLSEAELRNLIGQLEAAQKDPSKVQNIDLKQLGFTQSTPKATTLLDDNVVQITNSGRVGSNSKLRLTADSSATEADVVTVTYNRRRSTTPISVVTNSILDDNKEETTTMRTRRTTLPPVKLDPVPGIDNQGDTQVRGQLINAAVNVTRAISQFLGSAIQGAAQSIQSFIGSGSRQVGNYFGSTSALTSSRPG